MGTIIGDLLPLALGVAISPLPIIATILMLLGRDARTASIGFAAGWFVGIAVAVGVFVSLGGLLDGESGSHLIVGWIKVILGALLIGESVREFRSRAVASGTPKWMDALDSMTPIRASGMGFALAALNPKNLMMCIAAGVTIAGGDLDFGARVGCAAFFTIAAALTIVVPVVAYQVAAPRLQEPLETLRAWLQTNSKTVMSVLVLVIGVALLGKGVGTLWP